MEQVPLYLDILFALTTALCVWLFYKATQKRSKVFLLIIAWIILQGIIALTGFYTITRVMPPRFALLIGPPLLFIIILFLTKKGRGFLDMLSPAALALLHIIRIPVELVLYGLFIHGAIPELMTFEGRNLDILSGITAPLVWWAGYRLKVLPPWTILAWNLLCLGLLINIVSIAVLSAPFPFQSLAFDQPNIGVLYFPYVWLPAIIVPVVLLAHLTAIRAYFIRQHKEAAPLILSIEAEEILG
jgi:hypothetical protein